MFTSALSGPQHAVSSARASRPSTAVQCFHQHSFIRSVPCRQRQHAGQQRSLVPAAAQQSSSQSSAATPAEQSDAADGVAVSTMDALLTVMDDATSDQEEQASSASSTEPEVPAAVLEATAELSEEESPYTPEDATRYLSLIACCMHGWTRPDHAISQLWVQPISHQLCMQQLSRPWWYVWQS